MALLGLRHFLALPECEKCIEILLRAQRSRYCPLGVVSWCEGIAHRACFCFAGAEPFTPKIGTIPNNHRTIGLFSQASPQLKCLSPKVYKKELALSGGPRAFLNLSVSVYLIYFKCEKSCAFLSPQSRSAS